MMNEFGIWVEIEKLIDDLQGIFRRKKGNVGKGKNKDVPFGCVKFAATVIFLLTVVLHGLLNVIFSDTKRPVWCWAVVYTLAAITAILWLSYIVLRGKTSVRWALLLYLIALLIAGFLYAQIYQAANIPVNSLIAYWIFVIAFCVVWCIFSMLIDNSVSELVNGSISNLTTVVTIVFNIVILSLPEDSIWKQLQFPFNLFISPFLLTSSISTVLVAIQKYCLKKYGDNSKKDTEADSRDED